MINISNGLAYDKVCFSDEISLANSVSQAKSTNESPLEPFKSQLSIITYLNGLSSANPLQYKGGMQCLRLSILYLLICHWASEPDSRCGGATQEKQTCQTGRCSL